MKKAYWNDVNCGQRQGFVCERAENADSFQVKPEVVLPLSKFVILTI